MGGCRHRRKGQKWRNNTFWTLANRKHSYFTTRLDFWKTEQMVVTSLKIKVERTWREYLLGTSSGLSTLPALRLSILPTTPSRETGATPSLDRGGDQAWQEKLATRLPREGDGIQIQLGLSQSHACSSTLHDLLFGELWAMRTVSGIFHGPGWQTLTREGTSTTTYAPMSQNLDSRMRSPLEPQWDVSRPLYRELCPPPLEVTIK